jgi:hypothetical protein
LLSLRFPHQDGNWHFIPEEGDNSEEQWDGDEEVNFNLKNISKRLKVSTVLIVFLSGV